MSAPKFKMQFNKIEPSKGEINTEPSKTVPDQNLSIRQLLYNHTRGIPSMTSMKEPLYFDREVPQIDDLTDLQAFREEVKQMEDDVKTAIGIETDAAKEAAKQRQAQKDAVLDNVVN